MVISEQQIINAICEYISNKKQLKPENVIVELMYDDDYGFSAEVQANGRQQILVEANLIEALRGWLMKHFNYDPISVGLKLILDEEEGIIAKARV
jgi:hypothetical protein